MTMEAGKTCPMVLLFLLALQLLEKKVTALIIKKMANSEIKSKCICRALFIVKSAQSSLHDKNQNMSRLKNKLTKHI